MVKASERLARVIADNGKHQFMFQKFGVKSMPTILFLGPEGTKVDNLKGADAKSIIQQINAVADKHNRAPKWAEDQEKGIEAARTDAKPVLMYFHDDGPKSQAAEKAFTDPAVADFYDKFVWIKRAIDMKSKEAKELGVTGPTLWIVDGREENPLAKPLKKYSLPKGGLKGEFTSFLKTWKAEPMPKKEAPATPEPAEEPKEENK